MAASREQLEVYICGNIFLRLQYDERMVVPQDQVTVSDSDAHNPQDRGSRLGKVSGLQV